MSNNRFKFLDTNDNNEDRGGSKYIPSDRNNRFQQKSSEVNSSQVNSRWQRSKSPEERNSFTKPQGNDRGFNRDNQCGNDRGFNKNNDGKRYDKGGFGKYRYNRGRRGPSVFDNVQKDSNGRPMLAGATTGGFDIGLALQKQKPIQNKESKSSKKKKKINFQKHFEKLKVKEKITEKERKSEIEWNKQMILNMQYEWETDSEDDEISEKNDDTDDFNDEEKKKL